jgi:protein translocase SecG subunit
MLYGILLFIFIFLSFLLIFLILLQQSKNSMGLSGSFSGSTQMIFGGSGGQDIFKKITWFLGISYM